MKEQNIKIVAKENNSSATGRKIAFGLTTFELALWVCSAVVVAASYFLSKSEASSSLLSLAASLVGVTALIFVSAGKYRANADDRIQRAVRYYFVQNEVLWGNAYLSINVRTGGGRGSHCLAETSVQR